MGVSNIISMFEAKTKSKSTKKHRSQLIEPMVLEDMFDTHHSSIDKTKYHEAQPIGNRSSSIHQKKVHGNKSDEEDNHRDGLYDDKCYDEPGLDIETNWNKSDKNQENKNRGDKYVLKKNKVDRNHHNKIKRLNSQDDRNQSNTNRHNKNKINLNQDKYQYKKQDNNEDNKQNNKQDNKQDNKQNNKQDNQQNNKQDNLQNNKQDNRMNEHSINCNNIHSNGLKQKETIHDIMERFADFAHAIPDKKDPLTVQELFITFLFEFANLDLEDILPKKEKITFLSIMQSVYTSWTERFKKLWFDRAFRNDKPRLVDVKRKKVDNFTQTKIKRKVKSVEIKGTGNEEGVYNIQEDSNKKEAQYVTNTSSNIKEKTDNLSNGKTNKLNKEKTDYLNKEKTDCLNKEKIDNLNKEKTDKAINQDEAKNQLIKTYKHSIHEDLNKIHDDLSRIQKENLKINNKLLKAHSSEEVETFKKKPEFVEDGSEFVEKRSEFVEKRSIIVENQSDILENDNIDLKKFDAECVPEVSRLRVLFENLSKPNFGHNEKLTEDKSSRKKVVTRTLSATNSFQDFGRLDGSIKSLTTSLSSLSSNDSGPSCLNEANKFLNKRNTSPEINENDCLEDVNVSKLKYLFETPLYSSNISKSNSFTNRTVGILPNINTLLGSALPDSHLMSVSLVKSTLLGSNWVNKSLMNGNLTESDISNDKEVRDFSTNSSNTSCNGASNSTTTTSNFSTLTSNSTNTTSNSSTSTSNSTNATSNSSTSTSNYSTSTSNSTTTTSHSSTKVSNASSNTTSNTNSADTPNTIPTTLNTIPTTSNITVTTPNTLNNTSTTSITPPHTTSDSSTIILNTSSTTTSSTITSNTSTSNTSSCKENDKNTSSNTNTSLRLEKSCKPDNAKESLRPKNTIKRNKHSSTDKNDEKPVDFSNLRLKYRKNKGRRSLQIEEDKPLTKEMLRVYEKIFDSMDIKENLDEDFDKLYKEIFL